LDDGRKEFVPDGQNIMRRQSGTSEDQRFKSVFEDQNPLDSGKYGRVAAKVPTLRLWRDTSPNQIP
jgi:hypothetical protein